MRKDLRENAAFYSRITICFAGVIALIFIAAKYILPLAAPFFIAWGIAFATRPISTVVNRITHIPVKVIRPIFALILIAALLGGFSYLIFKLAGEAWQLLSGLGENSEISAAIRSIFEAITDFFGESENSEALEEYLISAASSLINSLLSSIGSAITGIAASVPGVAIFILVTVISSVYFSSDLENVNKCVKKLLPERVVSRCIAFKNNSLKIAVKYMRSYFLIMLIIFSIMIFGLAILKVRYALLMAIIIALLDILPVIGIGTVLVPWALWSFVMGNNFLGVGLLVLFAAAEIIRQVIEPRIVGNSLGIHPILTLILIYGGYKVFGFLGLLLIPVFAIVIKTLIEKFNSSEVEQ